MNRNYLVAGWLTFIMTYIWACSPLATSVADIAAVIGGAK